MAGKSFNGVKERNRLTIEMSNEEAILAFGDLANTLKYLARHGKFVSLQRAVASFKETFDITQDLWGASAMWDLCKRSGYLGICFITTSKFTHKYPELNNKNPIEFLQSDINIFENTEMFGKPSSEALGTKLHLMILKNRQSH